MYLYCCIDGTAFVCVRSSIRPWLLRLLLLGVLLLVHRHSPSSYPLLFLVIAVAVVAVVAVAVVVLLLSSSPSSSFSSSLVGLQSSTAGKGTRSRRELDRRTTL